MPLHDAVLVNYIKMAPPDIKAVVPCIWTKGCMLDNCVSTSRVTRQSYPGDRVV